MVGVPYFLNRLKDNFDIWLLSVLQWLYHTETASKYYLTNKFLTIVKKLQSYIENNLSAISFGTVESWSVGFMGKSVTISEDQEWKHCWALLSLTFTSEKLKDVEGVSLFKNFTHVHNALWWNVPTLPSFPAPLIPPPLLSLTTSCTLSNNPQNPFSAASTWS